MSRIVDEINVTFMKHMAVTVAVRDKDEMTCVTFR